MKQFPTQFTPKSKNKFAGLFYRRIKCYLRRDIFEHVISHTEENYFSLEKFSEKIKNISGTDTAVQLDMIRKMAKEVVSELEKMGWFCTFSYGDTALYIHSEKEPPKTCISNEVFVSPEEL